MPPSVTKNLRSVRSWAALGVLVGMYAVQAPVEAWIFDPLRDAANLHMFENGEMSLGAYGALMVVRLVWNAALVAALSSVLNDQTNGFPIKDPWLLRHTVLGLGIGISVMSLAIIAILACGDAELSIHHQSVTSAAVHGTGWLLFDGIGSLGEELFGRAALLLVSERFLARGGAIAVSAIMFSVVHIENPGASPVWLARLALQGAVLAYAVYRTGSLWWSVGYHTGWNWASAPLFGAAGSGYLDAGHLLDLQPTGAVSITGGQVGPEGSVFAFVAVGMALALLCRFGPRHPYTG